MKRIKNKTKNKIMLYGRNSVLERIKANPKSIRRILVQDNFDVPNIIKQIRAAGIPLERASKKKLMGSKRAEDLQGIVAEVNPFEYAPFEELVAIKQKVRPTLLFLDRIYDPHNLGSIMRIAACFGLFAVVIPQHKACKVTEAVIHVASGGENYVVVALVSNLTNALLEAKKQGYWIVGATVEEGEDLSSTELLFPLGLVLGSEGEGIRYGVEKHLDKKVRIPMKGAPLSLNVAMACAISCHEIAKQR
ncbi:MAG: 23S rRNA (guanosine(2251)-2'-O)-methyltransferase RlmB [Candidatus Omnitrophota bacterium]|nr:MAG: 23S rRNA (guanosine(2251)-2'-O)-methyltransferase RlmB [Candidatus Omnitrophota bacterium]